MFGQPRAHAVDQPTATCSLDAHRDGLNELFAAAFSAAWQPTRDLLGENAMNWRWGGLYETSSRHPLLDRFNPEMASNATLPRYPRGGDGDSPNTTSFNGNDFSVASGASRPMVLDVGREDQAEMTNAPGQSGEPRSPFYANLLEG